MAQNRKQTWKGEMQDGVFYAHYVVEPPIIPTPPAVAVGTVIPPPFIPDPPVGAAGILGLNLENDKLVGIAVGVGAYVLAIRYGMSKVVGLIASAGAGITAWRYKKTGSIAWTDAVAR